MSDPRAQEQFRRTGVARHQRCADALDPESAKIDERKPADLLAHAQECAGLTDFINPDTNTADGDWAPLFDCNASDVLEKRDGNLDAHLALFAAFLQLMEEARAALNGIARRHLDFYYERTLRFERKQPQAGKAHVVFELKKNVPNQKLDAGTVLFAPKGLRYELANDLVVNGAAVARLMAVQRRDAACAGAGDSAEGQPWNPFGGDLLEIETASGFAVASRALRLNEGVRVVDIRMTLSSSSNETPQGALLDFFQSHPPTVEYTGPKDWVDAGPATVTQEGWLITASVRLDAQDAPVVDWDPVAHGGAFDTALPVFKLTFTEPVPESVHVEHIHVERVDLDVSVEGLRTLQLENDQGRLDPTKPFMPFTAQPEPGSRLYVRCDELEGKPLTRYQLNTTWSQSTRWAIAKGKRLEPADAISPAEDLARRAVPLSPPVPLHVSGPSVPADIAKPSDWRFTVSSKAHLPEKATIDSLTFDYDAQDGNPEFFHVGPFGSARREPGDSLLPAHEAAELYLGVTGLQGGENLTLLFGIDEGGDDAEHDPLEVRWEVLSHNDWQYILVHSDTTNGLLTSGIVTVAIPEDPPAPNSFLPPDCLWLRASVAAHPAALGRVISVDANAALAQFADTGGVPPPEAVNLPAGSLSKLAVGVPAVRSVKQPYPSFDGRAAETDPSFYARVSERLRHKNRAVAPWDFERIVLAEFDEIQFAQCVPYHHSANDPYSPGAVAVVVLRKLKHNPHKPNFSPRITPNLRKKIQNLLQARAALGVEVSVIDPVYRSLTVSMDAKFLSGFEADYFRQELDRAIQRFISPWAFRADEEIRFGGELHWSSVIRFAESLDYVDFVTNVSVKVDDGAEVRRATANGPAEILVSAQTHDIEVIE